MLRQHPDLNLTLYVAGLLLVFDMVELMLIEGAFQHLNVLGSMTVVECHN